VVGRTDILQPTSYDDPHCLSYHDLTSSVSNFKVRDRNVYVNDLRGSGYVFVFYEVRLLCCYNFSFLIHILPGF